MEKKCYRCRRIQPDNYVRGLGLNERWGKDKLYICIDAVACEEHRLSVEAQHSGDPMFYELTQEEIKLHDEKNNDYRSKSNPLANFERVAAWMALYPDMDWAQPELVAVLFAQKQIDSYMSLMERGMEGGVETTDSRAQDVHVYWKIARIIHRRKTCQSNK